MSRVELPHLALQTAHGAGSWPRPLPAARSAKRIGASGLRSSCGQRREELALALVGLAQRRLEPERQQQPSGLVAEPLGQPEVFLAPTGAAARGGDDQQRGGDLAGQLDGRAEHGARRQRRRGSGRSVTSSMATGRCCARATGRRRRPAGRRRGRTHRASRPGAPRHPARGPLEDGGRGHLVAEQVERDAGRGGRAPPARRATTAPCRAASRAAARGARARRSARRCSRSARCSSSFWLASSSPCCDSSSVWRDSSSAWCVMSSCCCASSSPCARQFVRLGVFLGQRGLEALAQGDDQLDGDAPIPTLVTVAPKLVHSSSGGQRAGRAGARRS